MTGTEEDPFFLDWPALWADTDDETEWLYEPILARGRAHAIYGARKDGKSLLLLNMAGRLATGPEPIVVVYLDYEMTEDDVKERLEAMGYGPGTDLTRLRYALLPSLPPLDTMAGGKELIRILNDVTSAWPNHHLVLCIDTLSRAVKGEENSADTVRAFYSETGVELKRRAITSVRLDHAGKDPTLGQRGSSAKGDDVDVVWSLVKGDTGIVLRRQAARMRWVPEKVSLHITEDPLRYVAVAKVWTDGTKEMADTLDKAGVELSASHRTAAAMLRTQGTKVGNAVLSDALRYRREQAANDDAPVTEVHGEHPREHLFGNTPGNTTTTNHEPPGHSPGEHPREHPGTPTTTLGNRGGVTVGNTPVPGPTQPRHHQDGNR